MMFLSRINDAQARRGLAARCLALAVVALLALAGCAQNTQQNGGKGANFGDQKNHIHSMAALPGHPGTLLVGTHYGMYRTSDGGQTWKKVLGDPGQLAEHLMDQYLTVSPVNAERVYFEAISFPDLPSPQGTAGVYTSTDGGVTWKLVSALSSLPSQTVYYLVAGTQSEQQLYAYFPQKQDKGLYESMDGGATWQPLGTLPDTESLGLLVDPAKPGHLFMYSANGLFESQDNGATWQAAPGIKDGIQKATLAGSTVYATGDDGTFVSQDDGGQFTLAAPDKTFSYLVSSSETPTTVYGLGGSNVAVSTDGGKSWTSLSIPPAQLVAAYLLIDPDSSADVYLGNSYPVTIYSTSNSGQKWSQIAP